METPTLDNLSPTQWEVVKQLDRYLRTELQFHEPDVSYFFIIRFANARNFDLQETKIMLREYVTYFRGLQKEGLESWGPGDADFDQFKEHIQCGVHFTSKNGFPLLVYRVGDSKFKELLKTHSPERLVAYHSQLAFRCMNIVMPIASGLVKRRIEKMYVIFDMSNADVLSYLGGKLKEYIKMLSIAGQLYFPNVLQKLFIINAPMLFSVFWAVAKLLLHPTTQERIVITSGGNKEKLIEEFGVDHLPVSLGGKSTLSIVNNPGPWQPELDNSYKRHSLQPSDSTLFYEYYLTKEERHARETRSTSLPTHDKDDSFQKSSNRVSWSMLNLGDTAEAVKVRHLKTTKMVVSMHQ